MFYTIRVNFKFCDVLIYSHIVRQMRLLMRLLAFHGVIFFICYGKGILYQIIILLQLFLCSIVVFNVFCEFCDNFLTLVKEFQFLTSCLMQYISSSTVFNFINFLCGIQWDSQRFLQVFGISCRFFVIRAGISITMFSLLI